MVEKRWQLRNINPFEQLGRKSKSRRGESDKKAVTGDQDGKISKAKQELKKLQQVTKESQDVLFKVNSVFPMALFPDTITVDRHKLTIIYRQFFWMEQTVSVPLADIKNIQADMGPFFGSLTVTSDHFINNTQTITYLWRKDAKCIQELVQGAMMAYKEQIDITKVSTKELFKLLTELGKGHSSPTE